MAEHWATRIARLKTDPERTYKSTRRYRAEIRAKVFAHYGSTCACCGSTRQLGIDHINGDGKEHREQLFGGHDCGSYQMYAWLVRSGFPAGFQTLCSPCNSSKADGAQCGLHATGAA